ncbi:hypothetical protein ACLHDG_05820 [Sulfurovum sp. CS9]|uniref:hypothetical protein n=1 Tax=Sulfurovum sp. CS9 TaxID=3391146 RepID=UPI0039E9AA1A
MAEEKQHLMAYGVRQQLFIKYTIVVLVDLTVLNLFNQYWDYVFIETFMISLLTATLLQFLMQVAIKIEHYAADFLETKMGLTSKIYRVVSAWTILFISKLVILEAINLSFGDSVVFSGPIHGVVSFLAVVIVIIIAEQLIAWIYRSLSDTGSTRFIQIDPLNEER